MSLAVGSELPLCASHCFFARDWEGTKLEEERGFAWHTQESVFLLQAREAPPEELSAGAAKVRFRFCLHCSGSQGMASD